MANTRSSKTKTQEQAAGAVEVRLNEASDGYELGAEVEGVWIGFVHVPAPQIRATIENVRATEAAAATAGASEQG